MYKKFHHIGIATKSIEKELKFYESLGYQISSDYFIDEKQGVRGLFIEAENQPRLELLENFSCVGFPVGGVTSMLKKNIKMYHIAYKVSNIEDDIKKFILDTKAMVINPIKDAVYFKKVCFLVLKNMQVVELVEEND